MLLPLLLLLLRMGGGSVPPAALPEQRSVRVLHAVRHQHRSAPRVVRARPLVKAEPGQSARQVQRRAPRVGRHFQAHTAKDIRIHIRPFFVFFVAIIVILVAVGFFFFFLLFRFLRASFDLLITIFCCHVPGLCGLPATAVEAPTLLILDIPDNGGFYTKVPDSGVTKETITTFLDEYKAKRLERQQLKK